MSAGEELKRRMKILDQHQSVRRIQLKNSGATFAESTEILKNEISHIYAFDLDNYQYNIAKGELAPPRGEVQQCRQISEEEYYRSCAETYARNVQRAKEARPENWEEDLEVYLACHNRNILYDNQWFEQSLEKKKIDVYSESTEALLSEMKREKRGYWRVGLPVR